MYSVVEKQLPACFLGIKLQQTPAKTFLHPLRKTFKVIQQIDMRPQWPHTDFVLAHSVLYVVAQNAT